MLQVYGSEIFTALLFMLLVSRSNFEQLEKHKFDLFVANFRGDGAYCYHQPCDDIEHYLTEDNVNFLGKTVDSIVQVIHKLSEPQASKLNGTFCPLTYSSRKHTRVIYNPLHTTFELVHEKTNNFGFRPGPTQTELCNQRRWLEAGNFGFIKYQLRGHREADQCLCFRICRLLVFLRGGLFNIVKLRFTGLGYTFFYPKHRLWVLAR